MDDATRDTIRGGPRRGIHRGGGLRHHCAGARSRKPFRPDRPGHELVARGMGRRHRTTIHPAAPISVNATGSQPVVLIRRAPPPNLCTARRRDRPAGALHQDRHGLFVCSERRTPFCVRGGEPCGIAFSYLRFRNAVKPLSEHKQQQHDHGDDKGKNGDHPGVHAGVVPRCAVFCPSEYLVHLAALLDRSSFSLQDAGSAAPGQGRGVLGQRSQRGVSGFVDHDQQWRVERPAGLGDVEWDMTTTPRPASEP